MNGWVTLDKEWLLRPTQDGLELLTPERNIALELSEPERRDEIASIFLGEVSVANNEEVQETILGFVKQDILQYSNCKPLGIERTETEKQIRSATNSALTFLLFITRWLFFYFKLRSYKFMLK